LNSLSSCEEWSTTEGEMKMLRAHRNFTLGFSAAAFLATGLLSCGTCAAQSAASSSTNSSPKSGNSQDAKASDDPTTTRLKIVVTNFDGKPVASASVYVRFNEPGSFLHKDKLAEMAFKTNDDGSVKVPNVPVGKVLIQVVGKGLHTYGKWFDVAKDQEAIEIKLERPPHWY
jgi:hypothetical protein